MVAVVVTERRILVVGRRGDIRQDWELAQLSRDDITVDAEAGIVRIGAGDDELEVAIQPEGRSRAILALAHERLP